MNVRQALVEISAQDHLYVLILMGHMTAYVLTVHRWMKVETAQVWYIHTVTVATLPQIPEFL